MPASLLYLLELSVSLALLWLFYQFLLRRLTFYSVNRWFLLVYSMACFFLPLVDIGPWLGSQDTQMVRWAGVVPSISNYTDTISEPTVPASPEGISALGAWDWTLLALLSGTVVLGLRLLVRLYSLYRLRKEARLITRTPFRVFQVRDGITPFSFGDAVYINPDLHSEQELRDIIQHEFVHVRQRHTADILWSEWLCMVQWFNPFAWLLRASIRQNLEFIADQQALKTGIDPKTYQYLLLKVSGNSRFSIAQQFNFHSLKKRIAMMNKLRSAKIHLARFLFLLPMAAVLLLAFRSHSPADEKVVRLAGIVVDGNTHQPLSGVSISCNEGRLKTITDEKGYYQLEIPYGDEPLRFSLDVTKKGYRSQHQQENWGNFNESWILEQYGNSFEFFGLAKGNAGGGGFSELAGRNLSRDDLSPEKARATLAELLKEKDPSAKGEMDFSFAGSSPEVEAIVAVTDTVPDGVKSPGYKLSVRGKRSKEIVVVRDMNGQLVEEIPLSTWEEKEEEYEKKYGKLLAPLPPIAPLPPASADRPAQISPPLPPVRAASPAQIVPPAPARPPRLPDNVQSIEVDDDHAVVRLKTGQTEKYDLGNDAEKASFEKKYGKVMPPPPPQPATAPDLPGFENGGPAIAPVPDIPPPPDPIRLPDNVRKMDVNNKKATVVLKDGTVEKYDLSDETQKAAFEKKYGKTLPQRPRGRTPA